MKMRNTGEHPIDGVGANGVDFNITFIPSTFNAPHKEEFDNEYMRKLYDVGYEFGAKGLPWAKVPPGFAPPDPATK
jgi:hypothetical protein